jgi:hypothetical protein
VNPAKRAPMESPESSSVKRKPAATSAESSLGNSPRNQSKADEQEETVALIDMGDATLTLLTHPITAYSDDMMQSMLLIQSKMDTGGCCLFISLRSLVCLNINNTGRYRNAKAFIGDAQASLSTLIRKKSPSATDLAAIFENMLPRIK